SVTTYYESAAIVFVVPPTGSKGREVFTRKASKGRAGNSGANASSAPAEETKGTQYSGKAASDGGVVQCTTKRALGPFFHRRDTRLNLNARGLVLQPRYARPYPPLRTPFELDFWPACSKNTDPATRSRRTSRTPFVAPV
ncbi:unnamed protein product, partial [Ectocarpus sp. 12 AP-2014]